jgi:hypothetical protein
MGWAMNEQKKTLPICSTCPWLKVNQGKRHKNSWYSLKNLRRLWAGLRSGNAPGMVCHSSDPDNINYGGDKTIKEGVRRECGGAILLVCLHLNEGSKLDKEQYRRKYPLGLTTRGWAYWLERYLFGQLPAVEDRSSEVKIPFEGANPCPAK